MATAGCEQDSLSTRLLTAKKGRIREEKDPGVTRRYDEKCMEVFTVETEGIC